MWKKGMAVLFCVSTWLCLTGFAGLGTEEDDTLNSLMNQLTAEDVDRLLAEDKWDGMVMAKVDSSVSVRADATTDSAVIGRMFKGDAGEIVEQAEGWTMIQSGDVTGWVSDEYLAFGQEAEERAAADVPKVATVTAQTLKVRDEASTEAQVIDLIGMGETIEVGEEQDGWLEIIYSDGDVNYVSAEYVEVSYEYGEARTIEEVEAEEAARKAAEEKEKRTANLGAVSASADELTLLAALIQAEAGNQPYEGQVAVGAVVMNRVRSIPQFDSGRYFRAGTVWSGSQRTGSRDSGVGAERKLYAGGAGGSERRDDRGCSDSFPPCRRDRRARHRKSCILLIRKSKRTAVGIRRFFSYAHGRPDETGQQADRRPVRE